MDMFGYLYVYMCITSHKHTHTTIKTCGNYSKNYKALQLLYKNFLPIPSHTCQSNSMLFRERESVGEECNQSMYIFIIIMNMYITKVTL